MVAGATAVALAFGTTTTAQASDGSCHSTAAGTANYVNEVPDGPLEVTCEIGIYFDEDGTIDGVKLSASVADARPSQTGIYIDGADIDVLNSTIDVEDDYPHQFAAMRFQNGAISTISDNDITGFHRVGILARGSGTDVTIEGNSIIGVGPKTTGWAENGIQLDQGASGSIIGNTVADHWWDNDDWVSSGILVYFTNGVTVENNIVRNNDFGVGLYGENNTLRKSLVQITDTKSESEEFYGVFVYGDNNMVTKNTISSNNRQGLGLGVLGSDNALRRNVVRGWDTNIHDYTGTNDLGPNVDPGR